MTRRPMMKMTRVPYTGVFGQIIENSLDKRRQALREVASREVLEGLSAMAADLLNRYDAQKAAFLASPFFVGIQDHYIAQLINQDILSPDDLQEMTEQETLALYGIGPVTVARLKQNGLPFKVA